MLKTAALVAVVLEHLQNVLTYLFNNLITYYVFTDWHPYTAYGPVAIIDGSMSFHRRKPFSTKFR